MAIYLGEVLLDKFGGSWVKRPDGPCVCLRQTAIGKDTEVNPGAWVSKRLHFGKQDSLRFKAVVLATNTEIEWSPDWPEDTVGAAAYGEALGMSEVRTEIDSWIRSWLAMHKEVSSIILKIKPKISETQQLDAKYRLENDSMSNRLHAMAENGRKYLLGRLVKMYDGLNYVTFGTLVSGNRIRPVLGDQIFAGLIFKHGEFLVLLEYLQGSPVGPNGDLFKNIWEIEARSDFFGKASEDQSDKATILLLELNAQRGFHHNIKDFKKILKMVGEGSVQTLGYLPNYRVSHRQGCYQAIEHVLGYPLASVKTSFERFQLQRDIILWLDSAAGRHPGNSWLDKISALEKMVPAGNLESICRWILDHKGLVIDSEMEGWRDDVYGRFLKSATWYRERAKGESL